MHKVAMHFPEVVIGAAAGLIVVDSFNGKHMQQQSEANRNENEQTSERANKRAEMKEKKAIYGKV